MSDRCDAATTELAHVRVELVAALAERDQAIESRDAIASAHGVLVVEVMRLKEQLRVLEENNNNLATAILHGSERGQS